MLTEHLRDTEILVDQILRSNIRTIDAHTCPGYAMRNPAVLSEMVAATVELMRQKFEEAKATRRA